MTSLHPPREKLDLLEIWLRETGELFVTIYPTFRFFGNVDPPQPGVAFFIHSVDSIAELVAGELKERTPERPSVGFGVRVYGRLQYPMRGIAGPDFLAELLPQIDADEYYEIVSLSHCYPPYPLVVVGMARGRQEFVEEFSKLAGQRVGVGLCDRSTSDRILEWGYVKRGERFELIDS